MPNEEDLTLPESESGDESGSVRPFWSGTISFGLVSIPVDLYPANRTHRFGLRTLSEEGTPLRRRYFSSKSDRELNNEDLIRGRELEDGRYVVVTDEELEKLAPEQSRDIDLRLFVQEEAIPPQYFEKAYFLTPVEGGSTKAYRLLGTILQKTARVGVGTFVMRGKEYLAAIFSKDGVLCAETLRFADELRSAADIGLPEKSKVDARMLEQFSGIIQKEAKPSLSMTEMHDEVTKRLLDIVDKKKDEKENVVKDADEAEEAEPKVISILDVLKRSLAETTTAKSAEPAGKTSGKRASSRREESESPKSTPQATKKKNGSRKATRVA